MADILLREEDLTFASTMVHTLNTILLTSTELFQLRNQLKDLKTPVLLTRKLQPASFVCARGTAVPACPSVPRDWRGGDKDVTRGFPVHCQIWVPLGGLYVSASHGHEFPWSSPPRRALPTEDWGPCSGVHVPSLTPHPTQSGSVLSPHCRPG